MYKRQILTNLQPNDVLFIDEIHRLNRQVEEILYPALEDHAIDIIMGKGPSARSLRVDLNPFTLVGADVYKRQSVPLQRSTLTSSVTPCSFMPSNTASVTPPLLPNHLPKVLDC